MKQKAASVPDYYENHKNHKIFVENHKRRIYACLGLDSSVQDDLLTSPDSTMNHTQAGGSGARTKQI